jgi:hypothetical protein
MLKQIYTDIVFYQLIVYIVYGGLARKTSFLFLLDYDPYLSSWHVLHGATFRFFVIFFSLIV